MPDPAPPDAPKPALRHNLRRGALMLIGATAFFAVMSALSKTLLERYPFNELMFFRCALAIPVTAAFGWRGGRNILLTRRLRGHAARAVSGVFGMGCGFYSLALLPLADQIAVNYTQPLFVILLAIPWLGERPGPLRWAAVALGFAGVLVVALGEGTIGGPGAPLLGYALAAAGGFFGALSTMLVRQLSATESSTTIVMWQSILMTAMIALTLPFAWTTPTPTDLLLLILVGLIGGIAQVLLTEAYASAQVSSLGAYGYTGLLWGALLGWFVFADPPGWGLVLGSALIVAAGLLPLRERRAP